MKVGDPVCGTAKVIYLESGQGLNLQKNNNNNNNRYIPSLCKEELLDLESINRDFLFTVRNRIHKGISSALEYDSVNGAVISHGGVYHILWPKGMGLTRDKEVSSFHSCVRGKEIPGIPVTSGCSLSTQNWGSFFFLDEREQLLIHSRT